MVSLIPKIFFFYIFVNNPYIIFTLDYNHVLHLEEYRNDQVQPR